MAERLEWAVSKLGSGTDSGWSCVEPDVEQLMFLPSALGRREGLLIRSSEPVPVTCREAIGGVIVRALAPDSGHTHVPVDQYRGLRLLMVCAESFMV